MNTRKVLLGLAVSAAVGTGLYFWYKWYKEEMELEAKGISAEELKAEREEARLAQALEDRKRREEMEPEADYVVEGDIHDYGDGHIWEEDPDGRIFRRLTRDEAINGAEYDPFNEELVLYQTLTDEHPYTVVRKIQRDYGTRYTSHRSIDDIIESVTEMYAQIRALDNVDMEYEKRIYDMGTDKSLDYYRALCLYRSGIEDVEVRNDLIRMFDWIWTPRKSTGPDANIHDDIRQRRIEYFTFEDVESKHVTVAELILYFAEKLHFNIPDRSAEEYAKIMVDYFDVDTDDNDAVVYDAITAYLEHGRVGRENYDDTYGLFGLSAEAYDNAETLFDELNAAIEHYTNLD